MPRLNNNHNFFAPFQKIGPGVVLLWVMIAVLSHSGLVNAQSDEFKIAYSAYQSDDFELAGDIWGKLAESGDINAQYAIGVMELRGETPNASQKSAFEWFKKAADGGHSTAMFNIGVAYWEGSGVKKDRNLALEWWEKSAIAGDSGAQFNLGLAYYIGEEKDTDLQKAEKWIGMAAKQNHPEAERIYNILIQDNPDLPVTASETALSDADTPLESSSLEVEVVEKAQPAPEASKSEEQPESVEVAEVETFWKTAGETELLAGAGKSTEIIGILPGGAPVEIIRDGGNWVQITLPDGLKTWIFDQYLEVNGNRGIIRGTGVRVRPKPTTNNEISPPVGAYQDGDKVEIISKDGQWYEIRAPKDIGGWIPAVALEKYQDTEQNRIKLWNQMKENGL